MLQQSQTERAWLHGLSLDFTLVMLPHSLVFASLGLAASALWPTERCALDVTAERIGWDRLPLSSVQIWYGPPLHCRGGSCHNTSRSTQTSFCNSLAASIREFNLRLCPRGYARDCELLRCASTGVKTLILLLDLPQLIDWITECFRSDPIFNLDPADSYALVRTAAIKYNCSGDPIPWAVLDWAEEQLGNEPRIHGAGGEFARAFYYPGQRQHEAVSSGLVDRLARWRLFVNDAVDPGCLGTSGAEWAHQVTLGLLREIFTEYRTDWLTATDSFYLHERMARWAGLQLSVAAVERTLLGSFMHPEFVELARECPPEHKRGSRFMALVLRELDSGLARFPLDSGYIPANLARANMTSRLQSSGITGRKVVNKVRQRLSHSGRSTRSAGWLTQNVLEYWRSKPSLLDRLARQEMIDNDWLSQVLARRQAANAATVGFLMNLQIMEELRELFIGRCYASIPKS